MLSVGDLGGTSFSLVASSSKNRARFIDSLLEFVDEFQFDGVDIDWEFPQVGRHRNDRVNFIKLLRELRAKGDAVWSLDEDQNARAKRSRSNHKAEEEPRKFLLSAAVGTPLAIASTAYMIPQLGK